MSLAGKISRGKDYHYRLTNPKLKLTVPKQVTLEHTDVISYLRSIKVEEPVVEEETSKIVTKKVKRRK